MVVTTRKMGNKAMDVDAVPVADGAAHANGAGGAAVCTRKLPIAMNVEEDVVSELNVGDDGDTTDLEGVGPGTASGDGGAAFGRPVSPTNSETSSISEASSSTSRSSGSTLRRLMTIVVAMTTAVSPPKSVVVPERFRGVGDVEKLLAWGPWNDEFVRPETKYDDWLVEACGWIVLFCPFVKMGSPYPRKWRKAILDAIVEKTGCTKQQAATLFNYLSNHRLRNAATTKRWNNSASHRASNEKWRASEGGKAWYARRAAEEKEARRAESERFFNDHPELRPGKFNVDDVHAVFDETFNDDTFFDRKYPGAEHEHLHGRSIYANALLKLIALHICSTTKSPDKAHQEIFAWNSWKIDPPRRSKRKNKDLPEYINRRPVYADVGGTAGKTAKHFDGHRMFESPVECHATQVEKTCQKLLDNLPFGTVCWRNAGAGKDGEHVVSKDKLAYVYVLLCVRPDKLGELDPVRNKKKQKLS